MKKKISKPELTEVKAKVNVEARVSPKLKKWFVSAIIPGIKQLGFMQFEATDKEYQSTAEKLCPERADFRAFEVEKFDKGVPVGEFVDAKRAKKLGY